MKANQTAEERRLEDKETPVCPECGHSEMDTRWEDSPFTYGSGADAVEISVRLPVRKCCKCGFEFLDEEAEDLSHEAVCRHLGRLTPLQIKDLREKYVFSRADLERLTGLGEASIARWERGELIQNAGNSRDLQVPVLARRARPDRFLAKGRMARNCRTTSGSTRTEVMGSVEFPPESVAPQPPAALCPWFHA
jgi:putative zinc finger/helix-turn-helix YgiT family protein